MHFYFQDPGRQRKGAKHAALAEQRIIIPGVGLAVGSHGEEGRAALFFFFFLMSEADKSLSRLTSFYHYREVIRKQSQREHMVGNPLACRAHKKKRKNQGPVKGEQWMFSRGKDRTLI